MLFLICKRNYPNTYVAAADGVSAEIEVLKWWEKQEEKLPHWAPTCQQILLRQPSSAAVERVFSLLLQQPAESSIIRLALMLQYNKK